MSLRDLALVPTAGVTALAIRVFSADPAEWIVALPGDDRPGLAFCAVAEDQGGVRILLATLTLGPVLGLIGLAGFGRPRSWFGLILGAGLAAFWLHRFFLRVSACTP
ncbi:hypothetical protein [Methylobacterium sp. CM6257]|jgi:hypothetical protein